MLHIIGVILKILGIILLVSVGMILFLLVSILLVPIEYGGCGEKTESKMEGKLVVSWFLHLLHIQMVYKEEKATTEVYVLGIPVLALKNRIQSRRKRKKRQEKPAKESHKSVEREKIEIPTRQSPTVQEEKMEKLNKTPLRDNESKTERQEKKTKKEKKEKKKRAGWKKIRLTIQSFCDNMKKWHQLIQEEDTKIAIRELIRQFKIVIRHILPVKIKGKIVFGFEDPATTGYLAGMAGIFYPIYQKHFQLIPVFHEKILEGNIKFRGRICLGYVLLHGWKIYRKEEIRKTYDKIRHKEEA